MRKNKMDKTSAGENKKGQTELNFYLSFVGVLCTF